MTDERREVEHYTIKPAGYRMPQNVRPSLVMRAAQMPRYTFMGAQT